MERNDDHNRKRRGPPAEFWIKIALAATFIGPLLSHRITLLCGLIVLALPARWFRG